jgi:sRNA-binding regulator protein Hfq
LERPTSDDRRKAKRKSVDPRARARAEQLAASGMPMPIALAVAHGKVSLNEALEHLARRESVNRLIERHALSRALATQIALGQADLETVLARRRLQEHREKFRDRSVLDDYVQSGEPVSLLLHGHRRVSGKIELAEPYLIRFRTEEGAVEEHHKLQLKLAFAPDVYKKLRKVLKIDKALEKEPASPIARPQDRYTCSDKRLFRFLDEQSDVQVTLLEGEQLRGCVQWFSRYEFGLKLKGEADVVVFRHALHDLREAD